MKAMTDLAIGRPRVLLTSRICPIAVSAQGYEYDNVYIHFFMDLPRSKQGFTFVKHDTGHNDLIGSTEMA